MADEVAREIIENALKDLIDTKHLYQTVAVDFRKAVARDAIMQLTYAKRLAEQAKDPAPTIEEIEGRLSAEMALRNWTIGYPIQGSIMIMVPPVRTLCGNCKDVEPFNLRNGLQSVHAFPGLEAGDQVFCLELECQRCRKNVIVFEIGKNADSFNRVMRPSVPTLTTMSPNSDGSVSRPCAFNVYWKAELSLGSGGPPTTPAATWMFCSLTALTTSPAVMLRAAISSGLSHSRIE